MNVIFRVFYFFIYSEELNFSKFRFKNLVHLTIEAEADQCWHTGRLERVFLLTWMKNKALPQEPKGTATTQFICLFVSLANVISVGLSKKIWLTYFSNCSKLSISSIFPAWKVLIKGPHSGWLGDEQKGDASAFLSNINIKVWGILKKIKFWDD